MSLFLQWHRQAVSRLWEPRSQARMWARLVIIYLPILHHPSEMTLTQRNQEIQTTLPQAANQVFAIGICPRRTEGCFQTFHSQILYQSIQLLRVNLVPIVDQKAVPRFVINGFAKLLQGPSIRRMGSHIEVDESPGSYLHDDQYEGEESTRFLGGCGAINIFTRRPRRMASAQRSALTSSPRVAA
jgi:hypothetical protein